MKNALPFVLARMKAVVSRRKQRQPALDDRFVVPSAYMRRIRVHDDVQVVAHHRIGEHIGCEAGGDEGNPCLYPVFSVLEGLTCVIVDTAQERTPYAALHAVEGACGIGRNELGSWLSHDRNRRPVVWQPLSGNAAGGCREFLVCGCP